ncbi:hypothetical protein PhCBS80983_g04403 [Powellomyces hirtus]|uniref:Protein kinase domain-containing protein n=1 Tax=Powellomyces hirtus TaxID=109895 RepID=A0A507DXW5_9FUNG|nr:hypothetical protein PhCBS80983_g04403 [Powellomyces hirtus]
MKKEKLSFALHASAHKITKRSVLDDAQQKASEARSAASRHTSPTPSASTKTATTPKRPAAVAPAATPTPAPSSTAVTPAIAPTSARRLSASSETVPEASASPAMQRDYGRDSRSASDRCVHTTTLVNLHMLMKEEAVCAEYMKMTGGGTESGTIEIAAMMTAGEQRDMTTIDAATIAVGRRETTMRDMVVTKITHRDTMTETDTGITIRVTGTAIPTTGAHTKVPEAMHTVRIQDHHHIERTQGPPRTAKYRDHRTAVIGAERPQRSSQMLAVALPQSRRRTVEPEAPLPKPVEPKVSVPEPMEGVVVTPPPPPPPPPPPRLDDRPDRHVVHEIILPSDLPPVFEIYRSIDGHFENLEMIGQGTFGTVFKAHMKTTGQVVALKKITDKKGKNNIYTVPNLRELKFFSKYKHKNILECFGMVSFEQPSHEGPEIHQYFVLEYMDHDLAGLMQHLPDKRLYEIQHLKCIAKQLFQGLDYMHSQGVMHRDLKVANLLMNSQGVLKLADFGFARENEVFAEGQGYTNRVCTVWYRSIEILLGDVHYGNGLDLWGAGCVLAEMFLKFPIFHTSKGRDTEQVKRIFSICGHPTEEDWKTLKNLSWARMLRNPEVVMERRLEKYLVEKSAQHVPIPPMAIDLIVKLLSFDPAKRPSAKEALAHPFFTSELPLACTPEQIPVISGSFHEFECKERTKQGRNKRTEVNYMQSTARAASGALSQQPSQQHRSSIPSGVPHHESTSRRSSNPRDLLPPHHHENREPPPPGRPGEAPPSWDDHRNTWYDEISKSVWVASERRWISIMDYDRVHFPDAYWKFIKSQEASGSTGTSMQRPLVDDRHQQYQTGTSMQRHPVDDRRQQHRPVTPMQRPPVDDRHQHHQYRSRYNSSHDEDQRRPPPHHLQPYHISQHNPPPFTPSETLAVGPSGDHHQQLSRDTTTTPRPRGDSIRASSTPTSRPALVGRTGDLATLHAPHPRHPTPLHSRGSSQSAANTPAKTTPMPPPPAIATPLKTPNSASADTARAAALRGLSMKRSHFYPPPSTAAAPTTPAPPPPPTPANTNTTSSNKRRRSNPASPDVTKRPRVASSPSAGSPMSLSDDEELITIVVPSSPSPMAPATVHLSARATFVETRRKTATTRHHPFARPANSASHHHHLAHTHSPTGPWARDHTYVQ